MSRGDAGQRERQEHAPERLEAARSQAMRRADQAGSIPCITLYTVNTM